MFVDFFIKRPIFATVCSLMIILAGAVSIPTLPIAQFPNLTPPQVTVSSNYNGASAQVVETAVTTPLEQAINGVEGMKYITSSSGNDGTSSIVTTFDIDRNVDIAAVDVQNRVSTAQGRLPAEVNNTGISITKSGNSFVFAAGFYAEHGEYDSLFISNYVDVYMRDALKRVKGVGDVIIFGERKYSMRLWLDPQRMASRGLTASDVVSALQQQNVQVAAGQVGQQPAMPGQAYQISVRAVGRLSEPKQFDNIIVKASPDGTLVKFSDVGHAELGAENYATNLEFNGHSAVGVGVTQLSTANALQVNRDAQAALEQLAKSFPPGLKYQIAFNTTTVVGDSIRDVMFTLGTAIVLVILVIYIFLQDWRTTLIPAVTIPVSLIGTFAFVKLLGFSINVLTLFGITLATGLVVDDAIVVIENVQRHISEGLADAHKAASVAMGEVAGAVIATSLVLVAVFVPVAFFPGTTGILFRQFALTIAFSVAISAFNALTLTPALSAILLGHEERHGVIFTAINNTINAVSNAYSRGLHFALRVRYVVLLVFLVLLGATYYMYNVVPKGFIPNEDQGYFITIVLAPEGASLDYTSKICHKAEEVLKGDKEVVGVFAVPGFSFSGSAPNRALVFTTLKPINERKGKGQSMDEIIARVQGPLFGIGGAIIIPVAPPPIQGVGAFGGFQFVLQDQGGHSLEEFSKITNDMVRQGNAETGKLTRLLTSFTATDPQYVVTIDREKARALQVPLQQITDTLGIYMGSRYVNDFDFNNRSYRVYVQADKEFRSNAKDIRQFYVRSDKNEMIPLDNLVNVTQSTTPQVISHYNLFRSAEIDGSPAPGRSSGQAIADMEELAKKTLPKGMAYEWTGLSLEEIASGGQAVLLFGLGMLVVYLTLAAQYESFTLPFIVMLSVPMAVLGAVGAIALRGLQNDVYCQIGLVMLIGISSKNAILIVEFAEQLRAKGMSITEATVEAARIRLRPILMTSLAFILGVLPLVTATGAGKAGRQSVGTTVFGGMLLATALNLFFIPALYLLVKSVTDRKIVPAPTA